MRDGLRGGGGKQTVEQRVAACAASGPAAGVVPPVLSVVRQGLADWFAPAAGLRVIGFGPLAGIVLSCMKSGRSAIGGGSVLDSHAPLVCRSF